MQILEYNFFFFIYLFIFFFWGGGANGKNPKLQGHQFHKSHSLRNHSVLRLNLQIKIKPYPTVSSHQIKLIFVFCVILQCVYISKWCKQLINFVYGLVVGHVAYEQLYLGGVCIRRLSTTTRWRESCAISDGLVQRTNPLGLRGLRTLGCDSRSGQCGGSV